MYAVRCRNPAIIDSITLRLTFKLSTTDFFVLHLAAALATQTSLAVCLKGFEPNR